MKCPKPEWLLEYISIPEQVSFLRQLQIKTHARFCLSCHEKIVSLRSQWESFLTPEMDITPSLMKVYSRLQKDETLILKGWKLGEAVPKRDFQHVLFKEGWLFRGAIAAGLVAAIALVLFQKQQSAGKDQILVQEAKPQAPLAQIRVQGRNNIKVHYLQPELLQTVEFETTSNR